MGAGKTSVGRALARRLHWHFQDLDDLVEQRENRPIAEIFAGAGENAFREAEAAALRELLQGSATTGDLVLALGGGAFVQPPNRAIIEQAGAVTVLLEASLGELRRRCRSERRVRPLAQHEEKFAQLFASRRAHYEMARLRVQTEGKSIEQVAEDIERLLKQEAAK